MAHPSERTPSPELITAVHARREFDILLVVFRRALAVAKAYQDDEAAEYRTTLLPWWDALLDQLAVLELTVTSDTQLRDFCDLVTEANRHLRHVDEGQFEHVQRISKALSTSLYSLLDQGLAHTVPGAPLNA